MSSDIFDFGFTAVTEEELDAVNRRTKLFKLCLLMPLLLKKSSINCLMQFNRC